MRLGAIKGGRALNGYGKVYKGDEEALNNDGNTKEKW